MLRHALGLHENPSLTQDLMYYNQTGGVGSVGYPTTLDLYAVFIVAQYGGAEAGTIVTLPSNIPYTEWTYGDTPVPEFPNIFPVFASTLLLLCVIGSYAEQKEANQHMFICVS